MVTGGVLLIIGGATIAGADGASVGDGVGTEVITGVGDIIGTATREPEFSSDITGSETGGKMFVGVG